MYNTAQVSVTRFIFFARFISTGNLSTKGTRVQVQCQMTKKESAFSSLEGSTFTVDSEDAQSEFWRTIHAPGVASTNCPPETKTETKSQLLTMFSPERTSRSEMRLSPSLRSSKRSITPLLALTKWRLIHLVKVFFWIKSLSSSGVNKCHTHWKSFSRIDRQRKRWSVVGCHSWHAKTDVSIDSWVKQCQRMASGKNDERKVTLVSVYNCQLSHSAKVNHTAESENRCLGHHGHKCDSILR